ncbi:hypothetical protein A9Z06_33065 [Rhizobium sp. YK2]|nr:hypothetical protein A9Z06_33065 [Rhizobium sp. YK2]
MKMARSAFVGSTPSPKTKKAGMIRPFAIRLRISASTSVVKDKGGTAARLIMKGQRRVNAASMISTDQTARFPARQRPSAA